MESTNCLLTNSLKTTLLSDARPPDGDVVVVALVASDGSDGSMGNGFLMIQCTRKIQDFKSFSYS